MLFDDLFELLICQCVDFYIFCYVDGFYYFIVLVLQYDCIEICCVMMIVGLVDVLVFDVWYKFDVGLYFELIWVFELYFNDGVWYVYFVVVLIWVLDVLGMFQYWMYVICNIVKDLFGGIWEFFGQIDSGMDSFCLDVMIFIYCGWFYYLWVQKDFVIVGNFNFYFVLMKMFWQFGGVLVLFSWFEYDWECCGFFVNEGLLVLICYGCVFISYLVSVIDENYVMGLFWVDEDVDLFDLCSW